MKMTQSTNKIMMVRPSAFGYNAETAENNTYQQRPDGDDELTIAAQAVVEFDNFVKALQEAGVDVIVIQDSVDPPKPDAVFPNNWVSFHEDNVLISYPMFSPKRRLERREEILDEIGQSFEIERRYSFEFAEEDDMYLEGTGSMVLDRINKVVYACLSPRTNVKVLDRFCLLMEYEKEVFHAVDENGVDIYHTNVLMALGTKFAVICLEAITDETERASVQKRLEKTGREVVEISYKQKNAFAGNMLEVRNKSGETFIVMSEAAKSSLNKDQLEKLSKYGRLISVAIPTIEKYGGGSVRCMMAEIFLDEKSNALRGE